MDTPDLAAVKRKRVNVADENLVRSSPYAEQALPLVIEPAVKEVDLLGWTARHRPQLESWLLRYGALLFRGFQIDGCDQFEQFIQAACTSELAQYSYASTPRSMVGRRIYTSTEYPQDQQIPLHNEMSYASNWPQRICFYGQQPADSGGNTPLADSRRVYHRIEPQVRDRFRSRGVRYVRNYDGCFDLRWQDVFDTADKSVVESCCSQAGIEWQWLGNDRLRTWQTCQAIAVHPTTGEELWFNQAHLFHVSSLAPAEQHVLLAEFAECDLPRNAYYGDGQPLDVDDLEQIRAAYEQEAIPFSWQRGDLLMLDNMLTAHGRSPFTGERTVLVGMADMYR